MIRARKALLGQARDFFERELLGVFRWDDVLHHKAEAAEIPEGRARNPLGKYRECVVLGFGDFQLEVSSSEDRPPLGGVRLKRNSEILADGPLDVATWAAIGSTIKALSQIRAA